MGYYGGFPEGCTDVEYPNLGIATYAVYGFLPTEVELRRSTVCLQADGLACPDSGSSLVYISVVSGFGAVLANLLIIIPCICCLRRIKPDKNIEREQDSSDSQKSDVEEERGADSLAEREVTNAIDDTSYRSSARPPSALPDQFQLETQGTFTFDQDNHQVIGSTPTDYSILQNYSDSSLFHQDSSQTLQFSYSYTGSYNNNA